MNKDNPKYSFEGQVAKPTILLFVLLCAGYALLWWVFSHNLLNPWLIGLLGAVLAYGMFTIAHEASHGNISGGNQRFIKLDAWLGWISASTLFFPYTAFKVIHLRHHAHTNDPEQDPDDYVKGKNFLDVFLRCVTLVFSYYVHALGTESRHNKAMKKCKAQSLAFVVFLVSMVALTILVGVGQAFLFVFVIPATIAAPFLAFSFDWLPHYPHQNMGKHLNTRIVTIPGLEILSFFQSYHLIHHLHPRVPFYQYKAKFQAIETELIKHESPVEGWRQHDRQLFEEQNTYHDIANGSTWNYALKVAAVEKLTHDSMAIQFENVGGLPFKYKTGQYVVVSSVVNHEKVSRCYSICSDPNQGELSIGVKRVPGGLLSNKLLDTVKAGQALNVAGPFGKFNLKHDINAHQMVAGGSGITPMLSMLYEGLANTKASFKLIYGCRSSEDIMFENELKALAEQYAERFEMTISHELLNTEKQLELLGQVSDSTAFYLCGPTAMMDASKQALAQLRVTEEHIITEEFYLDSGVLIGLHFSVQSGSQSFEAYESETILEASRRNKMTLPHACGMGQCGTCKARLKSGEVAWKSNEQTVLLESEKAEGYILTCLCQAKSNVQLEN
ncbi:MAG: fatty acid desaturase [Bacteroidota bacterium]